jgi:hypothetical protein
MSTRSSRLPIIGVMLIGLSLAAAPAVFRMFERAPLGGEMIEDFHPYMTADEVALFRGYVTEIGAANTESIETLRGELVGSGAVTDAEYETKFAAIVGLNEQWAGIDADMTDLLDRMERNLDNFVAVEALPPFPMFPWFFVLPGLIIAGVAATVLWSQRHGRSAVRRTWMLAALGVGLMLAPVMFQMFTRAPQGADMIDDFRPMMTTERVQNVQGYFVTMGAAEGQLRTAALPLIGESGGDPAAYAAIEQFSADWPTIVVEFNPMVATMRDSLDNYAAVDALPSFALFPWFFVVPGALVTVLAVIAVRRRPDAPPMSSESTV